MEKGKHKKIRTPDIADVAVRECPVSKPSTMRVDETCLPNSSHSRDAGGLKGRAGNRQAPSGLRHARRRAQCTLIHVAQPIQPSLHWSTFDHSMYHFCQAHR